jgi:hypothetical protein
MSIKILFCSLLLIAGSLSEEITNDKQNVMSREGIELNSIKRLEFVKNGTVNRFLAPMMPKMTCQCSDWYKRVNTFCQMKDWYKYCPERIICSRDEQYSWFSGYYFVWNCEAYSYPKTKMGQYIVDCEGLRHPNDAVIVPDSCVIVFNMWGNFHPFIEYNYTSLNDYTYLPHRDHRYD